MKYIIKNLAAIIAASLLGIGIATAAPSSDCDDDDMTPIKVHSSATATNKDT